MRDAQNAITDLVNGSCVMVSYKKNTLLHRFVCLWFNHVTDEPIEMKLGIDIACHLL